MVQRAHAISIRQTRLSDTSLIVHWFTEEAGLVKTVAKGARRPKSPFAGKLDLFFDAEIIFQHAKKGELHTLKEVSILQWREGLRQSYTVTLLAAYCCQLVEAVVEPEHPEPTIHHLLQRALNHLGTNPASLRALEHFEKELCRILGVSHGNQSSAASLQDVIGRLPATRKELLDRISP